MYFLVATENCIIRYQQKHDQQIFFFISNMLCLPFKHKCDESAEIPHAHFLDDHGHLFPNAMLLTSFCPDRFKVGRLRKNRPNVHRCQCVLASVRPLGIRFYCLSLMSYVLKIMPIIIILSRKLRYCPVFVQIDSKLDHFVKIDRMYIRASVCMGIDSTPWNSVLLSVAFVGVSYNYYR
jgi:hypothetical protein